MSNYLYVNYAKVGKVYLSKVGISSNPERRITQFNLGIKYRTSFKNSPIFKRFFTAKVVDREALKGAEREILRIYKPLLMPFYGREVFNIHPEELSIFVNSLLGDVS